MNYDKLATGNNGKTTKLLGGSTGKGFLPGVSGNPKGRPNKSMMQKELERLANDPDFVKQFIAATAKRALAKGVAGFLTTREILDRVDGPVKQELNLSGSLSLEAILEARKRMQSVNGDGDTDTEP